MRLLGRQNELAELTRELDRGIRYIGVAGRSGVGKTAVLSAFAAAPPPGFEVWDVDLAGAPRGTASLDEAARRLGLTAAAAAGSPDRLGVDAIAARVRGRRVVLTVDHSDELALDGASVQDLFRQCPRLAIVVARHRLPDGPISLINLQPLDVPAEDASLEVVAAYASVRLFVAGAVCIDPQFRLTDATARHVAEICRLVGGLPLAIELAAARIGIVPIAQLARELRDSADGAGLDLLSARRGAPLLSIREALSSTCAGLTVRERRLLDLVAGFAGPFPYEAAVSICDLPYADALDDLERLVDLRLIEPRESVAGERVFDLLPIIRAYIHESGEQGAGDEPRRRLLLAGILHRAAVAARSAAPASEVAAAQIMRRDLVNVAVRLIDVEPGAAAGWLVDCANVLPGFAEGGVIGELLERLILSGDVDRVDQEIAAGVYLQSSYLLAMSPDGSGMAGTVIERHKRATSLIDELDSPLLSLQAKFLGMMSFVVTGDLATAAHLAAEGAREAEALPNPVWAGRFQVWMAAAAHTAGDVPGAIALALAAFERGSRLHDSYILIGSAVILHTLPPGSVPVGVPLPPLEDALDLARAGGDTMQEGFALGALVNVELDAGRYRSAARWSAERLAQCAKRGWSLGSEISLVQTVLIAVGLGDFMFTARMLGAVRADRERVLRAMAPRTRMLLDAAHATVTEHLGEAVASHLIGAGEMLSTDEASVESVTWLRLQSAGGDRLPARDAGALSRREQDVLELLARGQTNKEIATHLGISVKTVMHHSVAIYRKLAVRGRAEATAVAYRTGLITG